MSNISKIQNSSGITGYLNDVAKLITTKLDSLARLISELFDRIIGRSAKKEEMLGSLEQRLGLQGQEDIEAASEEYFAEEEKFRSAASQLIAIKAICEENPGVLSGKEKQEIDTIRDHFQVAGLRNALLELERGVVKSKQKGIRGSDYIEYIDKNLKPDHHYHRLEGSTIPRDPWQNVTFSEYFANYNR